MIQKSQSSFPFRSKLEKKLYFYIYFVVILLANSLFVAYVPETVTISYSEEPFLKTSDYTFYEEFTTSREHLIITELSINDSATAYQNTSTTAVSDFKQPIDTTETQDIENGEGGGRSNTEEFHSTRKHVTPHNYFKIRHRHR